MQRLERILYSSNHQQFYVMDMLKICRNGEKSDQRRMESGQLRHTGSGRTKVK